MVYFDIMMLLYLCVGVTITIILLVTDVVPDLMEDRTYFDDDIGSLIPWPIQLVIWCVCCVMTSPVVLIVISVIVLWDMTYTIRKKWLGSRPK